MVEQREVISVASGVEVARAYVAIIPKSDGTSAEVINSIVNPLSEGVGAAGEEAGSKFNTGLAGMLSKFAVPAAIGTALVAVGKMGFDAYSEVESGMMNVITATGATGEAAAELENVYKNVASNVVGSFEDIGSAVGEVNTRFGLQGDELQTVSEQYMKFAKVNGVDVVNSIDQTQKALTAFGLSAEDAPGLLDAMTKAGQNTGVSMEDLQNGLVQNSATFQEMGLGINESIGFLSKLEMTGANSSTVMSGLRKAMKNATADGKPLNQALDELQDSIANGTDEMDGLTMAYDLFGKSGDQVYAAIKNGSLDFNELTASMENADGALDDVYNNTLTASEKMDLAMQNIKIAGADLFAPIAESIATVMTDFVVPLAQQGMQAIGEFMSSVMTFYNANIKPVVDNIIAYVKPTVDAIVEKVRSGMETIGNVINKVMPVVQSIFQTVWPYIENIVVSVMNTVSSIIKTAWPVIQNIITTVMNAIKTIVTTVWPVIRSTITTAVSVIKKTIEGISSIISSVKSTFDSIKNAIEGPINKAKDTVTGVIDKIKGLFPISIGNIFSSFKLPHISITWSGSGALKIPHFDVDWYAKAYNMPILFTEPTVLPTSGGAKGFGDGNGAEIVYGKNALMRDIREAVAAEGGGYGNMVINVYPSPGMNEEELADKVAAKIQKAVDRKGAAYR